METIIYFAAAFVSWPSIVMLAFSTRERIDAWPDKGADTWFGFVMATIATLAWPVAIPVLLAMYVFLRD